jgi:HEAT repeat protein
MKTRTLSLSVALVALVMLCSGVLGSGAPDETDEADAGQPLVDPQPILLERVSVELSAEREAEVQALLDDRKRTIEQLCEIVDQKNAGKHEPVERAAAAYVLGEMRAPEAVGALNSALADDPVQRDWFGDRSPYDSAVTAALVRIGRPAVPEMIKNLQQSDDKRIREKTCMILYHTLGGRDRIVALIDRLTDQEEDAGVRTRLEAARAYVLEFYKDAETPLF